MNTQGLPHSQTQSFPEEPFPLDSIDSGQGLPHPSHHHHHQRHYHHDLTAQGGLHILDLPYGRILCVADIRGRLSLLDSLAKDVGAEMILHTGDFGFYDRSSLSRMCDRTLLHLVKYSPLLDPAFRDQLVRLPPSRIRSQRESRQSFALSELPDYLSGRRSFTIPVYTTYGALEDVRILERFRQGHYSIPNLYILDESVAPAIRTGGVTLRLLGLGGAIVRHKLFNNGAGELTIAGGEGVMWSTLLQMGELLQTAREVHDPSEVRILVSTASAGREPMVSQLAQALEADYTISAGLYYRYPTLYTPFTVYGTHSIWRESLASSRKNFLRLWKCVQAQVLAGVDGVQKVQLSLALTAILAPPPAEKDDRTWKELWCISLPDALHGQLRIGISGGRVGLDASAQGISYVHRNG
ncbi:MAG: hypothetical protein DHS80DRAFT_17424, partial [Piptocephalis tieghemiana]